MKYLRTIIVLFLLLAFAKHGFSQEESANDNSIIQNMVASRQFVLEANLLYNRNNKQIIPQSTNNFIMVKGDTLVIQTTSPNGMGLNGLGGFTTYCDIQDYEVINDKEDDFINLRIQITSSLLGQGTINMTLNSIQNARAQFIGNFGQRFMFRGELEELEESVHFQGFAY